MLKFFEAVSKVQKDRQVIRDTDTRMAKYSRRGLISNFLVYTLCLVFGQNFIVEHQKLAIVLTLGLALITLLRGYLLFRFDAIYPRAPTAWRNKYFIATLLGASWWGVIMASVTLTLGVNDEAALLWLFTVIFFSTTAHPFAPYQKFLSIYQFLGIVPAAMCTFFIGEFTGLFYGSILLFFYWILNHQCELISKGYWEHLEAKYTLARRTESLEEEKRDTRALVQLSNEYITLLRQSFRGLVQSHREDEGGEAATPVTAAYQREMLAKLYSNLDDFHKILNKELDLQPGVFNVRHYVQLVASQWVEQAERKGLELEMSLSPALPARLIGDVRRLGQVLRIVLATAIDQTEKGILFLEVEFLREYETSGELLITLARYSGEHRRIFFNEPGTGTLAPSLDLALAKGIADAMDGHLDVGDGRSVATQNLRFRTPMRVAELSARLEYHRLQYRGRAILLVHPDARWLDLKRLELDTMGFDVQTANDHRKALQLLLASVSGEKLIESVVYSMNAGNSAAVEFSHNLLGTAELKHLQQFVICSSLGRRYFQERMGKASAMIHFVDKPCGIFEFEMAISTVFGGNSERFANSNASRSATVDVLWISPSKSFDHTQLFEKTEFRIHRVAESKQLLKLLEEDTYQLILVEGASPLQTSLITRIREFEQSMQRENLLPIIGVGASEDCETLMCSGADHFIEVETLVAGDIRQLRYWLNGRNH